MSDLRQILSELRRPRLLMRAARCGQPDYVRARDLRRLLRRHDTPAPAEALVALIGIEAGIEEERQAGGAGYNALRHIEVMIALMAEARTVLAGPANSGATGSDGPAAGTLPLAAE